MSENTNKIINVVGTVGEALTVIYDRISGQKDVEPEGKPPVGAPDTKEPAAGTLAFGASPLLIAAVIAWFLFK